MGLATAVCPLPDSLAQPAAIECIEYLGQIYRLWYQRLYLSSGVLNKFTIETDDPSEEATWTAAKALTTNAKVITGPQIDEPVQDEITVREYGGGNATRGGVTIRLGENATPFNAKFLNAPQSVIKTLKALNDEPNMGVYLINEAKKIIGLYDDIDTPTEFYPIPVQSLFFGSKNLGGFEGPDFNKVTFNFFPDWSDNLAIITPETGFNPILEL